VDSQGSGTTQPRFDTDPLDSRCSLRRWPDCTFLPRTPRTYLWRSRFGTCRARNFCNVSIRLSQCSGQEDIFHRCQYLQFRCDTRPSGTQSRSAIAETTNNQLHRRYSSRTPLSCSSLLGSLRRPCCPAWRSDLPGNRRSAPSSVSKTYLARTWYNEHFAFPCLCARQGSRDTQKRLYLYPCACLSDSQDNLQAHCAASTSEAYPRRR
jgi:hypothetical protein